MGKGMQKFPNLPLLKLKKSVLRPALISVARNFNKNKKEPTASTLCENFSSLQDVNATSYVGDPTLEWSPQLTKPPPEPIRASERFFVKTGSSSSLIEEARLSTSFLSPQCEGQAATILSRDPDADFRLSMLEMVEARHMDSEEPFDWEFMEEMLYCFLQLNDRSVYKHIVRAFTDIVAAGFRRGQPGL